MKINLIRITVLSGGLLLLVAFINTQPAHLQTAVASKEEQELLAEINLAREHPQDYAAFIETYYKDQQTKEGPGNVAEVIRILKSTAALPPLQSSPGLGLSLAAKDLVNAQGTSGAIGHDIDETEARIKRYGMPSGTLGENVSYGSLTPRERIMRALVDDGIPSRVHRANILSKEYKEVGIACGPHKVADAICVTTMARDFTPYFPNSARLGPDNDNITIVSSVYNDNQPIPTNPSLTSSPGYDGTRVRVIPKPTPYTATPANPTKPTPASPPATQSGCECLERCCGQTQAKSKSPESADLTTRLLFPFVTNQGGFDTGITIANTTADPFGTKSQYGTCEFFYYGSTTGGGAPPAPQKADTVTAGSTLVLSLSSGGTNNMKASPGFQGYIIAQCNFPLAHGFYFISDVGARNLAMGGSALILPSVRSSSLPESLSH